MNFVSYAEMVKDVTEWSDRLPRDYDIVVAVPRSGILPASVLALHRNIKLTTVDLWAAGKAFKGGVRDQRRNPQRALVLDDSLLAGKSISTARQVLGDKVDYAAVYMKPGMESHVDYYCKPLPMPRIFEWNWMHHYWLQHACVDIDGVLCQDPESWENDDGPKYLKFLKRAVPKFIPTVQIGALVTSRLEQYRRPTEIWLAQQQISYKELIMHPAQSKRARQKAGDHAKRKAAHYRQRHFKLFVESSERQAAEINKLTGKPVLCTDTMKMYV